MMRYIIYIWTVRCANDAYHSRKQLAKAKENQDRIYAEKQKEGRKAKVRIDIFYSA